MPARVSVGSSAFVFGVYKSNPIPFDKIADRVQELGFQGIELVGVTPYGDPDEIATTADRRKFRASLARRGLSISNYGADFHGKNPASSDPQERKEYMALFEKNLRFCVDCEVPSMRVDTTIEPPPPPSAAAPDARKRLVEIWQRAAETAMQQGVLVVWEFEPGFTFNRPGEVSAIVKEVGHRNFTVLFDSCHAHMCAAVGARQGEPKDVLSGGAQEFARLLAGKIGYVHLIDSDNTLHDNWTSTHAPFGTGHVDFDSLTREIVSGGYRDDWWTIDLCFWPKAWEILEESKRFMDALLERHGLLA
jgi:sugar phosphate isomerase/epimerase